MVDAALVVVGAGPAGMAAATSAARRGALVTVVDSSPRLGGQYFRQSSVGAGASSPAGPRLPRRFRPLATNARVELKLGCSVWSAYRDGGRFSLHLDDEEATVLRAPAVVLATGASELVLPFPGWELPGVATAGAAQALLKSQHVSIGERVVVAGTGPFLLPVASSLARAGARVVVVEAAPARSWPQALAGVAGHPAKLAEAIGYLSVLARHRARFLLGHAVVGCEGRGSVERAVLNRLGPGWQPLSGTAKTLEADAVCVSYGFVPRLEVALQLGASTLARPDHPGVQVACDANMGTSVPGLFACGELAGVAGAEVAELEGHLAGEAGAAYLGLGASVAAAGEHRRLGRRLGRARDFAGALERLYPLGEAWTGWLQASTVFCRCEQSTWGAVKAAVAGGASTVREVRNLTSCGMGYCQGRTCGPALQLALSSLSGRRLDEVGHLHRRPVAVPVPLARLAAPGP
ncbi:MAG: FAD-dependent oxidoreductase [Acidimicrobiales bacterium]